MVTHKTFLTILSMILAITVFAQADILDNRFHLLAQAGVGVDVRSPSNSDKNIFRNYCYNFKVGAGIQFDINDKWQTGIMPEFNRIFYGHTIIVDGPSTNMWDEHSMVDHHLDQLGLQVGISRKLIDLPKSTLTIGIAVTPSYNVTDTVVSGWRLADIYGNSEFVRLKAKRRESYRFFSTKTAFLNQTYQVGKTNLGLRIEFNYVDIFLTEYTLEVKDVMNYEGYYNIGGPFLNMNIYFEL